MLIQMVSINVKEGRVPEFLEAFRINYEGTRKEPGNLRFDVLRDPKDENSFLIYEVFHSEAALASIARPNTTRNASGASTRSSPARAPRCSTTSKWQIF